MLWPVCCRVVEQLSSLEERVEAEAALAAREVKVKQLEADVAERSTKLRALRRSVEQREAAVQEAEKRQREVETRQEVRSVELQDKAAELERGWTRHNASQRVRVYSPLSLIPLHCVALLLWAEWV